jgi:1,4-dihydroxy-2-naphthoyl-CoA hydrolase
MAIWFKPYTLDNVAKLVDKYMAKHIGIELQEIGDDFIKARMPVDDRTKMPLGLLHGGASCVLAESLASYAAYFCIDPDKRSIVGIEINANHIRSLSEGWVTGICKPIHRGRSTHVWDIRISDQNDKLVCVSRVTIAIISKK